MCHAFIIDQAFMPPPIALPKFSNEMDTKWRSQIIGNKFSPMNKLLNFVDFIHELFEAKQL
jgi:hypothetical protein